MAASVYWVLLEDCEPAAGQNVASAFCLSPESNCTVCITLVGLGSALTDMF